MHVARWRSEARDALSSSLPALDGRAYGYKGKGCGVAGVSVLSLDSGPLTPCFGFLWGKALSG